MSKRVAILDGCGLSDRDLAPVLCGLWHLLSGDGSQIRTFALRDMKVAHCLGCFGCWLKTPGICVENDGGRVIAKSVIQSDTTVLFTPVTFGGYSPELKKMMERLIPLMPPHFQMDHGEVHHPPRYPRRPRMLVIGVQRHANPHEAHIFKTLAGRNAINLHPSTYASEVVVATDSADAIRGRFEAMLNRSDDLPFGMAAASLMPRPGAAGVSAGAEIARRALLLVGSPKTNGSSTSGVLGSYLLDRLGERSWGTESLTLRASLKSKDGQADLLAASRRAGTILLVFPLYVDSLPYLVTKALTVIAADRRAGGALPLRLMAIVNSGFPETRQNAVALAICEEFAAQSGIVWAGGLALPGAGIVGGAPLTATKRSGPPVGHVIRALDMTAAALSEGRATPAEAVKLMAQSPLPFLPFAAWRRLYVHFAGKEFEQEAAKNGVAKEQLLDQPYAD